jgi:hypothetical protein
MEAGELDERRRAALAWAWGALAYLACFFLSTTLPTPIFWYLPLEHRFELAIRVSGVAADFYGRVALATAAGAIGHGLSRLIVRKVAPKALEAWTWRAVAWLGCVVVFTAALYVYLLVGRHSEPAPLPQGYVPR